MKRFFISMSIILITAIYVYAEADRDIDMSAEKQRSMEAVKSFAGKLQAELKKGMKEGGPSNAISVCNTRAVVIAMDVSEKQDLTIKRVSLKNRNPDNAPNTWQKKVLEDFEKSKQSGKPMAELTYTGVAETETGKQFRFMKAIPTKPICIACHGSNIAPETAEKLDSLYPDDKALGFRPGDIRGAFVVTKDFPQ